MAWESKLLPTLPNIMTSSNLKLTGFANCVRIYSFQKFWGVCRTGSFVQGRGTHSFGTCCHAQICLL